jgi:hypothetical protein
MRYFLSTAGGEGKRPVVFLNGDAGKITGEFNTDVRAKYAERMSKELKTTIVNRHPNLTPDRRAILTPLSDESGR